MAIDNILAALLVLLPLGMWLRLPLPWPSIRVTVFDLLALVAILVNFHYIWRSLKSWRPLIIFLTAISLSWVISVGHLGWKSTWMGGLYLLRTTVYYLLLIPIFQRVRRRRRYYLSYLLWASAGLTLIGLGQYFLNADFRSWQVLGWDPHVGRLVGSFYDPGFLATLYLLFFIFWLQRPFSSGKLFILMLLFLSLGLSYARASWALALMAIVLVGWRKWRRSLIWLFAGIIFLYFFLPHGFSEGTRLSRLASIRGRWENGLQAIRVIDHHHFWGIGFNNIALVKTEKMERPPILNPKYSSAKVNKNSHSLAGFENSFLFLGAAGGLISLLAFGCFFFWIWRQSNFSQQILIIIFLVSGVFNNTLFYPLIVWPFWFLWSLAKDDK